jgi:hypothetical protein
MGEGGLNLGMDPKVVRGLVDTGRAAGRLVVTSSSGEWWDRHRVTRYRTLMQMLQLGLGRKGAGRECVYEAREGSSCGARVPFRDRLSACADGTSTLPGVDTSWCRRAMPASDVFVGVAALLGAGGTLDFDDDEAPKPKPSLRVVPTV